ncbi:MAG: TIGR04282 family arsenosugar biosynthesis glycosyltransferase [Candidatus Anammoxibacter sp.]
MSSNYLIIFIKYPEPGKVKTRLSKGIGNGNAVALYKLFVKALLNRVAPITSFPDNQHEHTSHNECDYNVAIFFSPEEKREEIKDWLGDKYKLYPQSGSNLGEKISNAFNITYAMGAKKTIIIGSDTPALKKSLIHKAYDLLSTNDAVIGPTKDGGYYLLGLSHAINTFERYRKSSIFAGISWSTEHVFNQTVVKLKQSNLSYKTLPEYYDIDQIDDLYLLKHEISQINNPKAEHLLEIYHQLEMLKI